MINYFNAAENTLRSRSMLEKALKNLMRRQERIMRHNSPSGYPSLDTSKPYTSTKSVNDALTDCIEIAEVAREINRTKEKIDEIDSVLQQLDPQDAELLRLWYIERESKEEIAEQVNYASRTSIYDLRNKAVVGFAVLYFGADAGALL